MQLQLLRCVISNGICNIKIKLKSLISFFLATTHSHIVIPLELYPLVHRGFWENKSKMGALLRQIIAYLHS